jgi:hypothetical protein
MLGKLRQLRKNEEGQAIVIGAVSVTILALAVCMTLQIGWGVHQKIQLQTAADNNAFTQAAVAARGLNFMAWVNRTAVLHYVSAMLIEAIPSVFTGLHATLGIARDIIYNLYVVVCIAETVAELCCPIPFADIVCCPLQVALEIIEEVLSGLKSVADGLVSAAQDALQGVDYIAKLVPLLEYLNQYILFHVQQIIKLATAAVLGAEAASTFLSGTDPVQTRVVNNTTMHYTNQPQGIPMPGVEAGASIYAAAGFMGMLGGTGGTPAENFQTNDEDDTFPAPGDDGQARAIRTMVRIANATRMSGGGGTPTPLSHRTLDCSSGCSAWAKILSFIGPQWDGQSKLLYPYNVNTFTETDLGVPTSAPPTPGPSPACSAAQKQAAADTKLCNTDKSNCASDCPAGGYPQGQTQASCQAADQYCNAQPTDCGNATSDGKQVNKDCGMSGTSCSGSGSSTNCSGGNMGSNMGSKLTGAGSSAQCPHNCVWTQNQDFSIFATGVAMNAAEHIEVGGIAGAIGSIGSNEMIVGIQATDSSQNDGAYHCHYGFGTNGSPMPPDGYLDIPTGICGDIHRPNSPSCDGPNYSNWCSQCSDDENHGWPGIANYVNFAPNPDPNKQFGQPMMFSAWSMSPKDGSFPGGLPFGLGNGDNGYASGSYSSWDDYSNWTGGSGGKLDSENIGDSSLTSGALSKFQGLNTMSGAQIYYHRPGDWNEHPNLFNPYWRAKLVPVTQVMAEMPLLGTVISDMQSMIGSVPGMPKLLIMH